MKAMIILIDSLAVIILILGWWSAFSSYPRLPDKIPVHFGITGQADGWGGRWMIFLLPVIGAVIFIFNFWLFNYGAEMGGRPIPPAARPAMHVLLLELSVIFTYITWRMSENAFGRARGLGVWFLPVTLLAIFATCGWIILVARGN